MYAPCRRVHDGSSVRSQLVLGQTSCGGIRGVGGGGEGPRVIENTLAFFDAKRMNTRKSGLSVSSHLAKGATRMLACKWKNVMLPEVRLAVTRLGKYLSRAGDLSWSMSMIGIISGVKHLLVSYDAQVLYDSSMERKTTEWKKKT